MLCLFRKYVAFFAEEVYGFSVNSNAVERYESAIIYLKFNFKSGQKLHSLNPGEFLQIVFK